MPSFIVGPYRIDLFNHVRVRGEDFPRPDPGAISEWFEADVFLNGLPLDLYPNQSPHPHPATPNRLTIGFVGREVVPVYADDGSGQIGTKRGADFRTRFWPIVARRLAKAQLAASLGATIGNLDEAAIASAPSAVLRLLRGDFTRPQDLKAQTLDAAVETLTGSPPRIAREILQGTVSNIDADFDSHAVDNGAGSYSEYETDTTLLAGANASADDGAAQIRFSLSVITAGSTINDVDFQCNITLEDIETSDATLIHPYNNTAADDPDLDNAQTKYSRSTAPSTTYISVTTPYQTTGSKTVDLGTTADGHVAGLISSPGFFALGIEGSYSSTSEKINIEAIENAGTDPATLTVDWTAPATLGGPLVGGRLANSTLLVGGRLAR